MGYQRDQRTPAEISRDAAESGKQSPPPAYTPTLPPRLAGPNHPETIPKAPYRPPLPPRDSGIVSTEYPTEPSPVYHSQPLTSSWAAQDPRNASTESLVPRGTDSERRTLLLIYVHGFLGNETSFQSFPAHVHNLATHLLKDTHTVHTKIYPRYKSRKAINFARDDFGKWLRPHESPETDVVLLGHSMGGILSADVVLMLPQSRQNQEPFAHRILGTINFDTPFLGMHPGVVVSGIGSLFRPADATPQPQLQDGSSQVLLPISSSNYDLAEPQNNMSMLQQVGSGEHSGTGSFSGAGPSSPTPSTSLGSPLSVLSNPMNDPNYNPRFENDVVHPVRKGWDSALHFVMKHSDGLTKATKDYVTSHLEFGGTMADYKGLTARYKKIRALEDVDDGRRATMSQDLITRRVRFVNYYTASTGRPSKPKPVSAPPREQTLESIDSDAETKTQHEQVLHETTKSRSASPHPTMEGSQDRERKKQEIGSENEEQYSIGDHSSDFESYSESGQDMGHVDPIPLADDDGPGASAENPSQDPNSDSTSIKEESTVSSSQASLNLPPIPPEPDKPEDFNPNAYKDKDVRKLAEKEYATKMKAYTRDVKDREKAISGRQKMIEKREKNARKAQEKTLKEEKKIQAREEKERRKQLAAREKEATSGASRISTESQADNEGTSRAGQNAIAEEAGKKAKPKRDRKFCMLPSKGANGQRDPAWIRVFMEGVDEVGAHCGLFFVDRPHYAQFVTDVGEKLKEWVEIDRIVREER